MIIDFLEIGLVNNNTLKFAVIGSSYQNKWIFVKHKLRESWEVPGGHREPGEDIIDTAKRELYEETGAIQFEIQQICDYSVTDNEETTYGRLCYAKVTELGELPQLEIGEVKLFEELPASLTYPEILPSLFKKIKNVCNK